jgi:hypothetical protein
MTTLLDKCKHTIESAHATQQLHQALRISQLIEKLLVAVVILTIATLTTNLAFAGDQDNTRSQPYAWVK